jgi:hypothetical protein
VPRQIPIPTATKTKISTRPPLPSIVSWNRLEGRPRSHDFDKSLRAEVRDPLWMLCRQWQFGEFKGEDAGSAVVAKTQVSVSRLNRFAGQPSAAQAYDGRLPLETLVEHEPIPFDLFTRAEMGRHWMKLIAPIGDFKQLYLQNFSFEEPAAGSEAEAQLRSDPQAWGTLLALRPRMPDGGRLYLAMTTQPDQHAAWLAGAVADANLRLALFAAAGQFLAWFQRTYNLPRTGDPVTWADGYLEYQFACSAPAGSHGESQTVLTAEQFASGHLDWYSFDVDASSQGLPAPAGVTDTGAPELEAPLSFIPNPITFTGMPAMRWWEFEDRRVNFGNIKPSTTDLAGLLLADFSLAYGNDWSLIPYMLPAGTLSQVVGVVVKDAFGVKTLVRPAGQTQGADLMRWGLFDLSLVRANGVLERLFVPPASVKLQQSDPIEKVILIRDDMSNMVWGIEHSLPAPGNGSIDGFEAAKALENYLLSLHPPVVTPPLLETGAPIAYRLGQGVPENWIPFIPVHNPGSNREIRLQRAAMPRLIPGYPHAPVEPRGAFLRPGLDQTDRKPYFIHEEEVSRTGISLARTYQRARWTNGQVVTWLGRRKLAGVRFPSSGQGSSGLSWDRIVPKG